MNYLAHFHLASVNDEWIVGALLGEFVKGPLRGEWPVALEQGMRLHRKIDAYTDTHPAREQFARELPAEYRRYAGIVLDVCCDHLLSLHWHRFHSQVLSKFAQRVYALLLQHEQQMPAAAAKMAQRIVQHDVLCIYDEWETVTSSLQRIGDRIRRANPLTRADNELQQYLPQAESAFFSLYPDLIEQCRIFSSEQ